CIPKQIAKDISHDLSIPTIGIGAGLECDGQVLVYLDLITYGVGKVSKFVKHYANVSTTIENAIASYVQEVKAKQFP
ncbi:3-methyl-2-oxobutanoate hydroxymethyltransferase, partial [Pseudomonas sp. FW305-BF6]|uniref:3-methyl-2-oxobutanoate hydroxymethyltransferase n=1 Tax=Pseudomonas sp. FW305-BF6 TaxID=2070673 RepID=UPI000CB45172